MKPRTVKFKPGQLRAVIDIFAGATRKAVELRKVVKTWQLPDGSDESDVRPERWAAELFPALRLDVDAAGNGFKTQATQQGTLGLGVTLGLEGTDPRDAADFWETFVGALYPCDRSILAALNPYRVYGYSVAMIGLEAKKFTDSDAGQIVQGRITIPFEFRASP